MSYGPYLSKVTIPNPRAGESGQPATLTYDLKDQEARDIIEAMQSAGLSFKVSTNAGTTPLGVTWDNNGTLVTGTLIAGDGTTPSGSTNTRPYIYLVPHKKSSGGTVDFYREYVTVNFGTVASPDYAWEFLGTTEIDVNDLGDMAYADTASGSVSVTGSTGTISSSGSFTPSGTVSKPNVTVSLTKATFSAGSLPSKAADTWSAGSLPSKAADTWSAGSLPSFSEGAFSAGTTPITVSVVSETLTFQNGTAPSKAADTWSAGSLPSFTEGTFSQGSLPSFSEGTFSQGSLPTLKNSGGTSVTQVVIDSSAELAATPEFTGSAGTVNVSSSGVSITSTGTVQVTPDA